MSLILNIDTSAVTASICLAENGSILQEIINNTQKDHAAFLHNAVKEIFKSLSLDLKAVDAIAVTKGPGSYTGLRVGMASAKGLCYALNKPFITIGSLDTMAKAAIEASHKQGIGTELYCPLIDARRMEVFTALFDRQMNEVLSPYALILNESSFHEILERKTVSFFGSGTSKLAAFLSNENAFFVPPGNLTASLANLSFEKLLQQEFTDLVHSEPLYVKEFHSSPDLKNKFHDLHNKK